MNAAQEIHIARQFRGDNTQFPEFGHNQFVNSGMCGNIRIAVLHQIAHWAQDRNGNNTVVIKYNDMGIASLSRVDTTIFPNSGNRVVIRSETTERCNIFTRAIFPDRYGAQFDFFVRTRKQDF